MSVYIPQEDSYLFSDFLEEYLSKNTVSSYLDMGTGSGILSETVSNFIEREKILAVDIDKKSLELVKKKGFIALNSNLFSKIPVKKKFDLITFNAPYLPEEKASDSLFQDKDSLNSENANREIESKDSQRATTGGKRGDEIPLRFLKQAKRHLNKNGKIFLLVSSLTPLEKISKFKPKIVAEKKIFFEKLLILSFS